MAAPRFEWDHRKDAENQRKHRIAFEEARTVFADEHARLLDDPDHSGDEDRFILLGQSTPLHSLHFPHTYGAHDDIIRIISARKATKVERQQYDARWHR